jgi:hypothetical protein
MSPRTTLLPRYKKVVPALVSNSINNVPLEASVEVWKGIEKAMGLPEDSCENRISKEINPCAKTAVRRT